MATGMRAFWRAVAILRRTCRSPHPWLVRVAARPREDAGRMPCPACGFRAAGLISAGMEKIGSLVILALLFAASASAQPGVTLTGRVTLNGAPAPARTMAFWNDQSLSEVTTLTDQDGRYRVALPHSGAFMVVVRGWSQTAHVTARDEHTQFDLAVEGATLTVDLYGNLDAATAIEVRRASPDFLAMNRVPSSTTQHVFEAVPFGTFHVAAHNGLASSQVVTVKLARDEPRQTVTLYLVPE